MRARALLIETLVGITSAAVAAVRSAGWSDIPY